MSGPRSHGPDRWLETGLAVWLTLCVGAAFAMRVVALGRLPGINGDEAYLGTKVWLFLRGGEIALSTGSHLPPDPLSFGLSIIAHTIGPISFVTLRAPSALSGVVAVAIGYWLFRRLWGHAAAASIAVLLACLPIHIAYSRFFWEPSQTPLLAVVALHGAFRRNPWQTGVAFGLALLVHPTNVFLGPVLLAPFVLDGRERLRALESRLREGHVPTRLGVLALAVAGVALVLVAAYFVRWDRVAHQVLMRVTEPGQLVAFVAAHADLLEGATVFRYLAGAPEPVGFGPGRLAFAIVFWMPVAAALVLARDRDLRCLALGTGASLALFFLLVGPRVLAPSLERYALWMTVPHCVLLGLSFECLAQRVGRPRWARLAVGAVGLALLLHVHIGYFGRLEAGHPNRERTFLTGPAEPKQRAYETILERRDPQRRVRILAEDWWTYWALEYLSLARSDVEVSIVGGKWDSRFPHHYVLPRATRADTQLFLVGYAEGRLSQVVARRHPGFERVQIHGHPETAILDLYIGDLPE